MLHEDVQSARARRIPIQLPCAYCIDCGTAFEQLEAVRRNEQGFARHINPVIGTANALQQAGCSLRSADLNDQIDRAPVDPEIERRRSAEHTSELQSLMRISYAVF